MLLTAFAVTVALAAVPKTAQPQSTTFTKHVAPIVFARCAPCHRPGGPAPFSLVTYEEVRRRAAQIGEVTKNRYMPPWKPEPGVGEFVGNRRLSDGEIATIDAWVRGGAPEGDPAALPKVPRWAPGWQLGEPDLIVSVPEYTLRPDGLDVFRNFVVSIPGDQTRFVRGLEFRPGTSAIHHANIRIDYTPASRRLDAADPDAGYEGLILHSADYPDGHFLGWTPGQYTPLAPRGLAWRLNPGGDFVVQLHMRPTGKPERIRPAIGIFLTNDAPTIVPAMLRLGRQNIDIPPGVAEYRSSDSYSLPVDVQVQAIQPHSHYRAREVKAWAVLPDGATRSLIYISRWDFAWQDVYRVAQPFWLPAGARLFTEYVFDNSVNNPRNPEVPPARVLWGFKSSDEMGDVWIQVLTGNDADRVRLVSDFDRKATAEDIVGYETRIGVDPTYAVLHDDVAVLYLELGQPEQAAAHFEKVVGLRPDSAVARYNHGTALEAAGRFAEATAAYEAALRIEPEYAAAHVNLGNMILRDRGVAEATGHYQEAVRLDPENAEAHNNLGRMLMVKGESVEAIDRLTRALRLRPSYVEAHFNLAGALAGNGKPREAVEHYTQALRLRPDWPPALIELAWLMSTYPDARIRRPAEAVRLATRAVELSQRNDAVALDALAAAYASAGAFDKAVSTASAAADLAAKTAPERVADIRRRVALYSERRPFMVER